MRTAFKIERVKSYEDKKKVMKERITKSSPSGPSSTQSMAPYQLESIIAEQSIKLYDNMAKLLDNKLTKFKEMEKHAKPVKGISRQEIDSIMERIQKDDKASCLIAYFLGRLEGATFVDHIEAAHQVGRVDGKLLLDLEKSLEKDWDPKLVGWIELRLERGDLDPDLMARLSMSYRNAKERTFRGIDNIEVEDFDIFER